MPRRDAHQQLYINVVGLPEVRRLFDRCRTLLGIGVELYAGHREICSSHAGGPCNCGLQQWMADIIAFEFNCRDGGVDALGIDHDFKHHAPKNDANADAHETVRRILREAAHQIDDLMPDDAGREMALVKTKLEEAMMWANAGVARHWPPPAAEPANG